MGSSVYVDESKRRDYIVIATAILPKEVDSARKVLRGLYLPGQRRLHMVRESPSRQRLILSTIADLEVEVRLYRALKPSYRTDREARERCLRQLINDAAQEGYSHLCLERDESIEREDRRVIRHALSSVGYVDSLRYEHNHAAAEPLLAIPDAVGWAWPQGKDWRRRCESMIAKVEDV